MFMCIYTYIHLETSEGIWCHLDASGIICRQTPDTQEAPRRHPGGTQEAPKRHPRGTQEAPRATKGSREDFDVKCAKIIMFYNKNGAREPFRVDGSDVTLAVPAACAQK